MNILRGEIEIRPSLQKTLKLKFDSSAVEYFEAQAGIPLMSLSQNMGDTSLRLMLEAGSQHMNPPITAEKAREIIDNMPFADDPDVESGKVHDKMTIWQLLMAAVSKSLPGMTRKGFIEQARKAGLNETHGLPPLEPSSASTTTDATADS